jgi:hypothetical protein
MTRLILKLGATGTKSFVALVASLALSPFRKPFALSQALETKTRRLSGEVGAHNAVKPGFQYCGRGVSFARGGNVG